ncbi:MAG: hypothetical protein COU47_04015 [Candidatus Niyogibacteria bacterium CG10_big_fil_rev_8_21_14_0_10_46_36]|uniref:DUF2238 domain-containing protein n=1 Tax=Candidatus Niyogibacteria bacterium CG10_big_fil_rev_8_21_14_0_10_46_36 TaxID=1974726 RepID=A0A2H0TCH6_9BACT|nr:MAG: hypothetical protein COU47_04015 [Candidatus Niyogibacteria bacterium CG10_big_fil_rev_8_21_14_0_10_46_36]
MFFKKEKDNFPAFLLTSLVIILGVHIFALLTSLYYILPWFDIAVHGMGGFWAASFIYYLLFYTYRGSVRMPCFIAFVVIVSGTALVGVLWEFFEFAMDIINIPFLGIGLSGKAVLVDTLLDLLMDIAGGSLAGMLLLWLKKNTL